MKKVKKLGAVCLATCLAIGSIAGCSSKTTETTNPTEAAKPSDSTAPTGGAAATAEDVATDGLTPASGTVKILSNVTGGKDEEEMALFARELGDATGLEVIIERPPADYNQVMMQKLQGGEKYDLIYFTGTQYADLVNQDALTDLTEWIASSKIFQENVDPQELTDITIDGKIYAGFNKRELHRMVALNKTQLEAAGIDYKAIEPTLDGYYQVMKKLKENTSGADYYPFNAVISETYDLQPWMASAGLKNGVVLDADGKKYAPYSTMEAAPVWEWLKKLYEEELMDPGAFVDKTKDMRAKMGASTQTTGICVDWAMWVGLHNAQAIAAGVTSDQYEIVSLPGTKTPDGSYMLVKGGASLFGIPVNAENPDGGKRVLEYFATQEGGTLLCVGVEGYDYTRDGNVYTLTEIGQTHSCDHGAPCPIDQNFEHPVGFNPGVDEAFTYLPYATIDLIIPNETEYKETVGKWAIQIIKGDVTVEQGLESMRKDLVALGITDK